MIPALLCLLATVAIARIGWSVFTNADEQKRIGAEEARRG